MKNSLFILTMLIALAAAQSVTISTTCVCAQMLTEADCGRRSGCSWDATKKACAITTTPTTETVYCDQYTAAAIILCFRVFGDIKKIKQKKQ